MLIFNAAQVYGVNERKLLARCFSFGKQEVLSFLCAAVKQKEVVRWSLSSLPDTIVPLNMTAHSRDIAVAKHGTVPVPERARVKSQASTLAAAFVSADLS